MRTGLLNNRIAVFLPSLRGGGAERAMTHLIRGMEPFGIPIDLVLAEKEGPFLSEVPATVRIIGLKASRMRTAILPLVRYLKRERPTALLARMTHANLTAIVARAISRVPSRVVAIEADNLGASYSGRRGSTLAFSLMRLIYEKADQLVAVSNGVARDLEEQLSLPKGLVKTIYNPVVVQSPLDESDSRSPHPWAIDSRLPLFVAIGRLQAQKDYPTLFRAFQRVRQRRPARLLVLGEGTERTVLELLAKELQIEDCVAMPGFVERPSRALVHATAYVLSSTHEGLPNAMLEALACGCPVVSTDCPSGPDEVLNGGALGFLVPTGDPIALADAMLRSIDHPWDREALRRRAADFSLDFAVREYLRVLGFSAGPAGKALAA